METEISRELWSEIDDFVVLNKLGDTTEFITDCIKVGFNVKQYGNTPFVPKSEYKKENKTSSERLIPVVPPEDRSKADFGIGVKKNKKLVNKKNNIYDE